MNTSNPESSSANVAFVRGVVRAEPVTRELPAGGVVAQFDLSVRTGSSTCSVPVAWADPSAAALAGVRDGTELLVVGSVQRRFFRVGGATQSRTEVVAESVIPVRRHKQVAAAIDAVIDALRSP